MSTLDDRRDRFEGLEELLWRMDPRDLTAAGRAGSPTVARIAFLRLRDTVEANAMEVVAETPTGRLPASAA